MPVIVKICGLNSVEAVQAVIAARADYAGFVYFPASPRHLVLADAVRLQVLLPASIQSVLVMVDPDDDVVRQAAYYFMPHYFQLHGKETPERIKAIKMLAPEVKIIKAVSVRSADDIAQAMQFHDCADMLMFDARPTSSALPGGNGLSFDWTLLKDRKFPLPWFLSGGLNAGNVADATRISGAKMVDVSSGVERAPGVKDVALIKTFVKAAQ